MFHRINNKAIKNTDKHDSAEVMSSASAVKKSQERPYRNRVESSAIERYARQQREHENQDLIARSANENDTGPIEFFDNTQNLKTNNFSANEEFDNDHYESSLEKQNQPINELQDQPEEENIMNNPEPQKTEDKTSGAMSPQNRDVNIPGNNFKRPAVAPAPAGQQAGRPSYPGTYAANTATSSPYNAQNNTDNGRKLVIGQGITMSGEIESCEHLIVEGTIEATLKGAQVLDVYESGAFLGTVEIEEANIAGRFEGDITVKGRLTIESTGQVTGSISYKELSMEAGAVIDGSVSPIGSENAKKNAASAKTSTKAKKASTDNGAELPFSDKGQAAE